MAYCSQAPSLWVFIMEAEINWYRLMQYTWLKDNNLVDIYEGDILSYNRTTDWMKKTANVEFDIKVWAWYCWWNLLSSVLHEQNNDDRKRQCNYMVHTNQYATVIWNIYQNPELLS